MARPSDTIAALATPAGVSALAIIRVSGPDTARLAREILGSPPPLRSAHHAHYRDRAGTAVDEARRVLAMSRYPNGNLANAAAH